MAEDVHLFLPPPEIVELKKERMDQHVKLLTEIVLKPAKFYWIANTPGQFDAAEYLFQNHADEVSENVADKIVEVLLRSGKYYKKPQ